MKKRIIPLFFLVLLLATVMIPTSAAISTKAISGKPTLKIEGTTAYCVGKPDNNQSKYGTSETLTASQFKVSNKSADILARIFCGHYERPGVPKISERVANAKKWYNFL